MKELKEFPGYFVTEDGKVFSAKKLTKIDYDKVREMKVRLSPKGYHIICLYKNKKVLSRSIHRLVAETYIENPFNLPQVNHIDENKTNNHVSNLEWVTHQQNTIYSKCRWIYEIENIITGEIIETINIREFSRENNLNPSHLLQTLTGKFKQHKGFRIISKKQFK